MNPFPRKGVFILKRTTAFILALILAIAPIAAIAGEYTLGPADELFIRVENHADLTMNVVVQPDGCISYPLAGIIPATGLTLNQLKEELTRRLSTLIPNPWVSVVLSKARPLRVQVLGEARLPGHLSLPQGSTAMQAIAQAGGPSEKADLENVLVTHRDGKTEIVNFKAIGQGNAAGDIVLQDGDTLMIPKGVMRVSVMGEVSQPGVYEIPKGARLIDALAAAGGPKNTAQLKRIRVYQGMGFEKPKNNAQVLFEGSMGDNPEMADGYVVVVSRNRVWDIAIVTSVITTIVAVLDLFIN